MENCKIAFDQMDWEYPAPGVQQKVFIEKNQRIRLLCFTEEFVEEDYCTKGHIGYVLEGEMEIEFVNKTLSYKKGDGLWIKAGEEQKHKAKIKKGKRVELILFEDIQLKD